MKLLLVSLLFIFSSNLWASNLPQTIDELEKRYLESYQNKDLEGIYSLINWHGVSRYKKKMVKVYTRNSLGKDIKKTDFETIDSDLLSTFSVGEKNYKTNLIVNKLFRIEFDNPEREESLVYLVGKSTAGYQFSLSINNDSKSTD